MQSEKITKADLCKESGIARTTLDAILNGSDAKISTIESLAKVLRVRIGWLFDEEPVNSINVSATGRSQAAGRDLRMVSSPEGIEEVVLNEKVRHLEELLKEKDERISELKERIEDLRSGK